MHLVCSQLKEKGEITCRPAYYSKQGRGKAEPDLGVVWQVEAKSRPPKTRQEEGFSTLIVFLFECDGS